MAFDFDTRSSWSSQSIQGAVANFDVMPGASASAHRERHVARVRE
jgi:hypothetical protein